MIRSPRLDVEHGVVELVHGAGGRATTQLVDALIAPALRSPWLDQRNDQALLELPPGRVAISTDGFVVSPTFFPGGNVGHLAVHGTINDLAMGLARPLYLTVGLILEEGLPLRALDEVVRTIGAAARECEVAVVTGDTKVVERGKGDGIFVTTTGVGVVSPGAVTPSADRARPGDHVLVSGTLGDHGLAILSTREGLSFEAPLVSDTAPLHGLVAAMAAASPSLSVLRDPTRGGLAATLNEICAASRVGVTLDEAALPIRAPVRAAAELLGIDPLDVANEGKLVAVVPAAEAPKVLAAMRAHPLGRDAADVGVVVEDDDHLVELRTTFGGTRIVRWPLGEPLPRIC